MKQLVERLGYLVYGVPDLAESTKFYSDVAHLTVHDTASGVAYLGGGYDHHWLRLEESAHRRGLVRVGYQLVADDALDDLADRLEERGVRYTEIGDLDGDGVDRGIRFTDPDGVEVDAYTAMISRAVKPTQDAVRMTDLLHAVWFSTDPVAAHDFYSKVLGFRASDWIKRNAVFMRGANKYHHSLGIFRSAPERAAKLDHFCILVEDIDDVMRGRNIAVRRGAQLQKDVLRHAASGSISVYIADPTTGTSFEFCTEHDMILDENHRPRLLEGSPTTRDVWQAGSPGLPPTAPIGATTDGLAAPQSNGPVADLANSLV